jgi:outer membrane protein
MDARRATLRQERRNLLLAVAGAFYAVLQARQEVATLEESVRLQQERLREVQARQRMGLARRTEVLLIETQSTSAEARLVRARNALESSRERLGLVIGAPADGPLVDSLKDGPPPGDLEALRRAARGGRADLMAQEANVRAARAQVSVVRGEFAPSVDLTGNYYLRRTGTSADIGWDVLFSLDFPLFQGGASRARYREAASKLRQSRLLARSLGRQVDVEVETAYLDLKASDALLRTLEAGLRSADENYRLIQEEYRRGIGTNLEVMTAYSFLENARLDLDREHLGRKVLWLRLRTAVGKDYGEAW